MVVRTREASGGTAVGPPLVSVIIPAHNAARFLPAAIESGLAQTYRPIELIVVDDGSTDDTPRVVRTFGEAVRYIWQENRGVSAARNRGIEDARGELVALLDADDEWLSPKLAMQVARMVASPDAVVVFTGAIAVDERTRAERRIMNWVEPDMVTALLYYGNLVGPPSGALVRREALVKVEGFDPQLSQSADWDMWLRLATVGHFEYVDAPLVRYRVHHRNMSRNVRLLETDTMKLLSKHSATEPHRSRYARDWSHIYSNHYGILSGSYLHAGDLRSSLRCLIKMLVRHPGNVRRLIGLPLRWARHLRPRRL